MYGAKVICGLPVVKFKVGIYLEAIGHDKILMGLTFRTTPILATFSNDKDNHKGSINIYDKLSSFHKVAVAVFSVTVAKRKVKSAYIFDRTFPWIILWLTF